MLTIQLLGPPLVLQAGQPIGFSRRRSRAVLYYLATHQTPVARQTLLDLLWPDEVRTTAQHGLRTALHTLRQQLGNIIQTNNEHLVLVSNVIVDTQQLEQAIAAIQLDVTDLITALDQYRGPFLDGFAFPEAPPFDDWIVMMRERYMRLIIRGLTLLSQHYDDQHQWDAALAAVERALVFDPLQEDLQRNAMRFQYLAGDRIGAIRRYEYVRNLLDEELGVPPMSETQAIYDAIITDMLPPPDTNSPVALDRVGVATPITPFVGRDIELAHLHTLVSDASFVLIEGEAGIGKTRLVTEWVQEVTRSTPNVPVPPLILHGIARELAHHVPYQPLMDALRSLLTHTQWPDLRRLLQEAIPLWLKEFACLLPETLPMRTTESPQQLTHILDETRLWESVTQALTALAQRQPVILLIDELHWADPSTLSFLDYLLHQIKQNGSSITILVTARPVTPHSTVGKLILSLTCTNELARLTLTRLDQRAIHALSAHFSLTHTEPLATWLSETSQGNPYMLTELICDAQARGVLGKDGLVDVANLRGALPKTIAALVQTRYASLPDTARRLLNMAALVGVSFDVDVVARAALLSDDAALVALDAAQTVGLIMPSDGMRYAFDHVLTQHVICDMLSEPQRRLIHRRIGNALERVEQCHLDRAAPRIADHYFAGHVPERAIPFALRAGRLALQVGGWDDALYWYTQALPMLKDEQRMQILGQIGQIYVHIGQVNDAMTALIQARDIALTQNQNEAALEIAITLIELLIFQGRYQEALLTTQEAQTIQAPERQAESNFLQGMTLALSGHNLDAATTYLQAAHIRLSTDPTHGSADLHAHILYELATAKAEQGHLSEAIAWYREAIVKAQHAPNINTIYWHTFALNALAYHLHLQGDPSAYISIQEALDLAQQHRTQGPLAFIYSTMGELALAKDELDTAEQHFHFGLDIARQLNLTERIAGITANLGQLALRRHNPIVAAQHLATALAIAEQQQLPHLTTTIQLWRIPLLPPDEARPLLAKLRVEAETSRRWQHIEDVDRLEHYLTSH